MPRLRIVAGSDAGLDHELIGTVSIGRDATAEVRIADRKSSRLHARLGPTPGGVWTMTDLGSANGVWQGEQRVSRLELTDGDEFRIGSTLFRFCDPAAPAVASPAGISPVGSTPAALRLEGLDPQGSALFPAPRIRSPIATGELQKANAFLGLLHRIVIRANVAQTRDELFELLDDTSAEVLEGDRCAVFLPGSVDSATGEAGWELWPAHARRLRARFGTVPFARTLLAAVRRRGEPLLSAGGGDLDPSLSMIQAGVRSAMAAPLRIGDELHALLYVDRLNGTTPFTRIELEFLAAVANQLAVQLTNRARVADLESQVERLVVQPPRQAPPPIVGDDPAIAAARTVVERAAASDLPALISGEPGTGKELVARHLYHASQRAAKPLQVVPCAMLGAGAEAALFGEGDRPGALEIAHQGTLLVDEVGELPATVQMRLAAAITQGRMCRNGDTTLRPVDVRLIVTTSHAPDLLAAELRGRCSALTVTVPPLAARGTDIDRLADTFLHHNATRLDQPLKHLAPEARTALLRHAWPGNVQELKDALERACVLAPDHTIRLEHLPEALRQPGSGGGSGLAATPIAPLADIEKAHILRVLAHCGGNKKAAAELLAIDRSTLYAKLKQYGLM